MENNEIIISDVNFKNFDNAKQILKNILNACNLEEVTIDNLQSAKKTRAALNKMKKSISTQRIAIKKEVMKPYDVLEGMCKELDSDIDAYSSLIDEGVKKVEEAFRQARKYFIFSLLDEMNLVVNLDCFVDPKWLNQSMSDKKAEKEIRELSGIVKKDVSSLVAMNHEFQFEMIRCYHNTLNLGDAIEEGNNLTQTKQRKEAIAREKAAEQKELEEEMRAVGSLGENETVTEDGEVKKLNKYTIEFESTEEFRDEVFSLCIRNNIKVEVL